MSQYRKRKKVKGPVDDHHIHINRVNHRATNETMERNLDDQSKKKRVDVVESSILSKRGVHKKIDSNLGD